MIFSGAASEKIGENPSKFPRSIGKVTKMWCRGYLGPGFMGKKGYFYSIFLVLFKVILTREKSGQSWISDRIRPAYR